MRVFQQLFGQKETTPLHQDLEVAAKRQQESDAIHAMADNFLAEIEALKDDNGRLNIDDPKVRSRLVNMVTELDAMQTSFYGDTPSIADSATIESTKDAICAHPAFTRVNVAMTEQGLRADVEAGYRKNADGTSKTASFGLAIARDEDRNFALPGTGKVIRGAAKTYWDDVDTRNPAAQKHEHGDVEGLETI